jgi:hypothetical protein
MPATGPRRDGRLRLERRIATTVAASARRHIARACVLGTTLLLLDAATGPLAAQTRTSLQQVKEAWLASDAVVYGRYEGTDENAGPAYHRIDVDEVWLGSPSRGPVLFKAPRGIQAKPGDQVLLMLWDGLNGSTHAFLEKSRRIYGDRIWETIGPDSVTTYLLPFSRYAFVFDDGRIDLGGTNIFANRVRKRDLRKDIDAFEADMKPVAQFESSEAVVEARVMKRDFKIYEVEDVPVEFRVQVEFQRIQSHKGEIPETFTLEYGSFPRSPRFEEGDDALLFLSRRESKWFLPFGKRSVYHVANDQVLETGQPLREFVKAMRGL